MRRNLRFVALLVKLKLSHMMMFRLDFFMVFINDGLLFVVQLLLFEAIYLRVDSIGGWSRGQMIIFVGTFSIINALNMTVFFFGVIGIPEKIRNGDLDQYLTKPVNSLLRITFESVNPGSALLVVFSVVIVAYGVGVAGVAVSPALALGYAALVLLMTLLWYDTELILRTLPFFFLSANGIQHLEDQMLELNFRIPGVLYRGFFRVLFYFVMPYGIMSTVPTQLLTRSISPGGLASAVATVVAFTAFALWFWRLGLRHYKSAGG